MYICNPYLFMKGDEVICPSCRKNVFVRRNVLISDKGKLVKCERCGAYVRYGKIAKMKQDVK